MVMVSLGIVASVLLLFTIVRRHERPWPREGHGNTYFQSSQLH
jgi:hypothetical protein